MTEKTPYNSDLAYWGLFSAIWANGLRPDKPPNNRNEVNWLAGDRVISAEELSFLTQSGLISWLIFHG